MSTIGARIKEKREEKKISRKQLGELIGKSYASVQQYETNVTEVPLIVVEYIAKALEVTSSYLLGSGEEKSSSHHKSNDRYMAFLASSKECVGKYTDDLGFYGGQGFEKYERLER